jgi:hypothetical protein
MSAVLSVANGWKQMFEAVNGYLTVCMASFKLLSTNNSAAVCILTVQFCANSIKLMTQTSVYKIRKRSCRI